MPTYQDISIDQTHLKNMPYKNVPSEDVAKVDACIAKLVREGKDESSAHAICIKQFQKAGNEWIDSVKDGEILGPRRQRIFKEGDYSESDQFPGFICTAEWIDEMIENFDEHVFYPVPIISDHAHSGSTAAVGWITKLEHIIGDGLYMEYETNPIGDRLIEDSVYKGFSPGWAWNFKDEFGDAHGATLVEVSFTNQRFFQQSVPAMASTSHAERAKLFVPITNASRMAKKSKQAKATIEEKEELAEVKAEAMDMSMIVTKDPSSLTDEEKQMLAEHWDALADDAKAKFKDVIESFKKSKNQPMMMKAEDEKKTDKAIETPPVEAKAKVEKVEATVDKSEASIAEGVQKDIADAKAELNKAKAELAIIKATAEFDSRWALNTAVGKLPPAAKTDFIAIRTKASVEINEVMDRLLKAVQPKALLKEMGSDSEGALKSEADFDKLVRERMAKDKLSYERAWIDEAKASIQLKK